MALWRKYSYKVYWEVTIDDEPATLELKWLWKSKHKDTDKVMIEIDEDPELIGFDFIGYPEDTEDKEIVWEGFPIVIPA